MRLHKRVEKSWRELFIWSWRRGSHHYVRWNVGEVLGLLHVINWIHALQFDNMNFEFNSKKIVDYFNIRSNDVTKFGAVVSKCKHYDHLFF